MAFCTECGANLPDGMKFCTECGSAVKPAAARVTAAAAYAPAPAYAPDPQPQSTPPPRPARLERYRAPVMDDRYAPVGTGAFLGFTLLFALPLIGLIACIILAVSAKKISLRNYARAMLILSVIGLILSVVLWLVASWAWEAAMEVLGESLGGALTLSDLLK